METYHEGELWIQKQLGEDQIAVRNGKVINAEILPGVVKFIERQNMLIVASVDGEGRIWTSALLGKKGFAKAEGLQKVILDLRDEAIDEFDPLFKNIKFEKKIGSIFIELESRRRYRINGELKALEDKVFELNILEAYPNCPMYIQRRKLLQLGEKNTEINESFSNTLDSSHRKIIEKADTFFISSIHLTRGLDASHRGGEAGFVKILDDSTLLIPDYTGNSMFNTLGNLYLDSRAGLLFFDFDSDIIIQLNGTTELILNSKNEHALKNNTNREWKFYIESIRSSKLPYKWTWEFLDYSPQNPNSIPI